MSKIEGKRTGGILQRIKNYVKGTPPPSNREGQIATSGNEYSQWPSGFDDAPIGGDVYVHGTCCKTAGEVKAATAKFYGPV